MRAAIMTLGAIMCLALIYGCAQSKQQRLTTAVVLSHGAATVGADAIELWDTTVQDDIASAYEEHEITAAEANEERQDHLDLRRKLEAAHASWRAAHNTLAMLAYRYVEDPDPGVWELAMVSLAGAIKQWGVIADVVDGIPDPPGWLLSMIGGE